MSRALYRFFADCGRMGSLDGVFVAYPEALAPVIGKEVYFGEVLGKHSEVAFEIEPEMFQTLSVDPVVVNSLAGPPVARRVGDYGPIITISGINPLAYEEVEE